MKNYKMQVYLTLKDIETNDTEKIYTE